MRAVREAHASEEGKAILESMERAQRGQSEATEEEPREGFAGTFNDLNDSNLAALTGGTTLAIGARVRKQTQFCNAADYDEDGNLIHDSDEAESLKPPSNESEFDSLPATPETSQYDPNGESDYSDDDDLVRD